MVPGATTRAPYVTIGLKIRGEEFFIRAIVSEMKGHDLLLGVDVLERLADRVLLLDKGRITHEVDRATMDSWRSSGESLEAFFLAHTSA